jgi:hypothetical protein
MYDYVSAESAYIDEKKYGTVIAKVAFALLTS